MEKYCQITGPELHAEGAENESICPRSIPASGRRFQDTFSLQHSTRRQGFWDRRELSGVKLQEDKLEREMHDIRKEEKDTKNMAEEF